MCASATTMSLLLTSKLIRPVQQLIVTNKEKYPQCLGKLTLPRYCKITLALRRTHSE